MILTEKNSFLSKWKLYYASQRKARPTLFVSEKQISYVQDSFSLQGVGVQYPLTVQPKAGRSENIYYFAK